MKKLIIAGAIITFSVVLQAVEQLPGWRSDFAACTNEAVQANKPLVLVWGNRFCSHCAALEEDLQGDSFTKWKSDKEFIFCFVEGLGINGLDPDYAIGSKEFAGTAGGTKNTRPGSYPYVTVYWQKTDGTISATRFSTESALAVAKAAAQYFEGWTPTRDPDIFSFPVSGNEFDRLEALATTRYVDVPINREIVSGGIVTNSIVATWPVDKVVATTNQIIWAADETDKLVRVSLEHGEFSFQAGEALELRLMDGNGMFLAESNVQFIDDPGNSVLNAKWIGEEFDYGEWTMDYEAAKKKDGHVLAMFSGVLWCPYCYGMETSLLASKSFTNWAKDNKVSLVLFDQSRASTPATAAGSGQARLLDYTSGASSTRSGGIASGAGYLSRKSIGQAEARKVIDSVTKLTADWLAPGSTAARLGNPTVLLVKDDKVEARFTPWRDADKFYDPDENIGRLNDLLLLSGRDESSNYIQTTDRTLAPDTEEPIEFQINDRVECFRLDGIGEGVWSFSVTNTATDAEIAIALCTGDTTLATGTMALTHRISSAEAAQTLYVRLTAYGDTYENVCRGNVSSVFTSGVVATRLPEPGTIRFASKDISIRECETNISIRVERNGGNYGAAAVKVVAEQSSPETGRYEWADEVLTWADGESGEKAVVLKIHDNSAFDGQETISFILSQVDESVAAISEDSLTVTISDSDKPSFAKASTTFDGWTTFAANGVIPLANIKGGKLKLHLVSGGLPKGIKLSYDRENQCIVISGAAKQSGSYTAEFCLTETVDGVSETGEKATVVFNVADPGEKNKWLGKSRSSQAVAMTTDGGENTHVLAGKFVFALSESNQIKAKFASTEAKIFSFSGRWQELNEETLSATTVLTDGAARLEMALSRDGAVSVEVTVPGETCLFAEGDQEIVFSGRIGAAEAGVFSAYAGRYTIQLPVSSPDAESLNSGSAAMTLRMTDNNAIEVGKMSYSALLPNGQAISGAAQLERYEELDEDGFAHEYARLPIFVRAQTRTFGAYLKIKPNAADTWENPQSSIDIPAVFAVDGTKVYSVARTAVGNEILFHDVYGSYFRGSETPAQLCSLFGLSDQLELTTGIEGVVSERYGRAVKWPTATLQAKGASFAIIEPSSSLKGKNSRASGIVKFKDVIEFENGRRTCLFSGVIMPGWVDCNCGEGFIERPFAAGSLYYTDYVRYDGRWQAVKRSVPMELRIMQ